MVNVSIIYPSFTIVDSIWIACIMIYQVGMRDVRLRFLLCVVILCLLSEFRVSEINYEINTLANRCECHGSSKMYIVNSRPVSQ